MSKEQRQLIAFWSFFFSLKIWRYSCLVFVFFLKKIFHSHHVFEKQWSITRPLFILPSEGLVMTILSFSYGNGYQTGCGIFIDNVASALRAAVATSIISYPTRSLNNCWLYKVYLLLVFLFRIFILDFLFFCFFFPDYILNTTSTLKTYTPARLFPVWLLHLNFRRALQIFICSQC